MDGQTKITGDQILGIVSDALGIPIEDFTSHSRKRVYVDARKIAASLMYTYTPLVLSSIAMKLGMKFERHDTIIHYNRVLPNLLMVDRRLAMAYEYAEEECMRYASTGTFIKDDISLDDITRDEFVKRIMETITWEEKGTTRLDLEVLYYKMFKLRDYDGN